jgi:hypothetical protein
VSSDAPAASACLPVPVQALIRDLVKCVQSHLHCFNTRQLVELLQAVCQLSHPSPRWVQSWQDAVMRQLKGLSCRELCTAAEVLLLHELTPSKPWAGLWCVAMEVMGLAVGGEGGGGHGNGYGMHGQGRLCWGSGWVHE